MPIRRPSRFSLAGCAVLVLAILLQFVPSPERASAEPNYSTLELIQGIFFQHGPVADLITAPAFSTALTPEQIRIYDDTSLEVLKRYPEDAANFRRTILHGTEPEILQAIGNFGTLLYDQLRAILATTESGTNGFVKGQDGADGTVEPRVEQNVALVFDAVAVIEVTILEAVEVVAAVAVAAVTVEVGCPGDGSEFCARAALGGTPQGLPLLLEMMIHSIRTQLQ